MVLPEKAFNDDEYALSRAVFEAAAETGTETAVRPGRCLAVSVCAPSAGRVRGSFGLWVDAECAIRDVDVAECAAVVFIGGDGVPALFDSKAAHRLAVEALAAGCVVGAICAAPSILARAGILDMKRANAHKSRVADLVAHGAVIVDEPVVVAERIVTAVGPLVAGRFAGEIVRLVSESRRGQGT
jgi:protease I